MLVIVFPDSLGGISGSNIANLQATLSDSTNKSYLLTPTVPNNPFGSSISLKLDDTANNIMPASEWYTLTFFTQSSFSTNYINNIGLYTASSSNTNFMIIDTLPTLGNLSRLRLTTDPSTLKPF